ncbi:PDZ domain-containing protein [Clostridium sp. B9]|uniref:PDZ domain-containing protein n=1 Tax=Clostridium sp. B9 TaxID=3423224 RepID=UPI003D2EBF9A
MNLVIETLRAVSYALVSPTLALMLIVIGILFYFKNRKIAFMQKLMLGRSVYTPLELTLSQILIGILGGIIASLILSFLGITFENSSLVDVILTASIFSIVYKNKFLKIPYIAMILGIIGVVLGINSTYIAKGFNFSINLTAIITLVGVISITEGILIMVDGKKGYLPIFTQKDGNLVGGFSFRRFWALPIGLLVILGVNGGSSFVNEINSLPQWLPFLGLENIATIVGGATIVSVASYGVISYDSTTFTRDKNSKILASGISDIIYGVVIVILAYILNYSYILTIILIIVVPFLYEIKIRLEDKLESKREPLYFSSEEDICILDVLPNSSAYEKGLRSGDRIIKINGETPKSEKDVFMAIKKNYYGVTIKIRKKDGKIEEHNIPSKNRGELFGVVLVPKGVSFDREVNELIEKLKKASQEEEQKIDKNK